MFSPQFSMQQMPLIRPSIPLFSPFNSPSSFRPVTASPMAFAMGGGMPQPPLMFRPQVMASAAPMATGLGSMGWPGGSRFASAPFGGSYGLCGGMCSSNAFGRSNGGAYLNLFLGSGLGGSSYGGVVDDFDDDIGTTCESCRRRRPLTESIATSSVPSRTSERATEASTQTVAPSYFPRRQSRADVTGSVSRPASNKDYATYGEQVADGDENEVSRPAPQSQGTHGSSSKSNSAWVHRRDHLSPAEERRKEARWAQPKGRKPPIWDYFMENLQACEPGCVPIQYFTFGPRFNEDGSRKRSCHDSGRAIDVFGIKCSDGVHMATEHGGRYERMVARMKRRMKGYGRVYYRNGRGRTRGHFDHAHFSIGCYGHSYW